MVATARGGHKNLILFFIDKALLLARRKTSKDLIDLLTTKK